MESPSTPDKHAASSSSPLSSSQSTAATTAERVSDATEGKMDVEDATTPSKASGSKAEGEVLTLDDSSDAEMSEVKETKGKKGKGKEKDVGKGTKRKSEASSSSAPSAKKSKPSTSKSAKASSSTSKKADDDDKKLVVLKGNKFVVKQKPIDVQSMASFLRERADFIDYACKLFRDDKSNTLSDYPEEHHSFIAKLIHESDKTLVSLAGKIKADLKTWIFTHLTATAEDSQDGNELDEAGVADRIPVAPLKTLISTLATRTNYGLSLSSLPSDYVLPKDGEGAEPSEVPLPLQYWVWEVEDEEMWVQEMKGKWEKRKAERVEIKSTCLSLFLALPEAEQHALLLGTSSSKASSSTAKSKAKGKAKAEDADDEGEDKDKEGGEKEKKPIKEKKPKKEKVLTEEEIKEREEKARVKAEKEAEKEAKRKEREEKRAAKAEKEDEKARIKAEKDAEEKKKADIAKKQKSMFTSFFVKRSASPAPVEAGPSSSPAKSSSTSDFDRVFHPFTVRECVTVAPVNRFLHDGKKVDVKINSMPELAKDAALAPLTTSHRYRTHTHNLYPSPPYIVRDTVQRINDASLTTQDTSELYDLLNDRSKIKVKLLKFHEDLRPGYVGTWTKTSVMVGARNPLGRETFHLNYDVDSEAEWEEEPDDPDAEDIGSDGGEDDVDGEAGENSDADSWLAEDDEIEYEEGYDADGDMVMQAAENGGRLPGEEDDDVVVMSDPQAEKERKRKEREAKKRKAEKERRKKKGLNGPILPLVKGPVWQEDVETVAEPVFKSMRIHFLNDASFGLNPFTFVSKPRVVPAAPASTAASSVSKGKENVAIGAASATAPSDKVGIVAPSSLANGTVNTLKAKRAGPKQPFPEDQVAAFLRHVHGSTKTRPVLLDEFVSMMKEQNTPIKKNTVEAKLKELDVKKVKGANIVDAALLAQYGISSA